MPPPASNMVPNGPYKGHPSATPSSSICSISNSFSPLDEDFPVLSNASADYMAKTSLLAVPSEAAISKKKRKKGNRKPAPNKKPNKNDDPAASTDDAIMSSDSSSISDMESGHSDYADAITKSDFKTVETKRSTNLNLLAQMVELDVTPDTDELEKPLKYATPSRLRATPIDIPNTGDNCVTILLRTTNPKDSLRSTKSSKIVKAALTSLGAVGYRFIRGGMAVDFKSGTDISQHIELKEFANMPVAVRVPSNKPCRSGIIGDMPLDMSEEEIVIAINEEIVNKIKVVRAQRLGPLAKPSKIVKIVVEGETLPERLIIGFQSHPVDIFIPKPLVCFNCQRLNHTSNHCRSKTRCLLCGRGHRKEDCDSNVLFCANCRQNHRANDPNCVFVQHARKICRVKATKNITFSAAKIEIGRSFADIAKGLKAKSASHARPNIAMPSSVNRTVSFPPAAASGCSCQCSSQANVQAPPASAALQAIRSPPAGVVATPPPSASAPKAPVSAPLPASAVNSAVVVDKSIYDRDLSRLGGFLAVVITEAFNNNTSKRGVFEIIAQKVAQMTGKPVAMEEIARHASELARPLQPQNEQ